MPFLPSLFRCIILGYASVVVVNAASSSTTSTRSASSTSSSSASLSPSSTSIPVVDLGYAKYRPTTINETGQYYNFSNIRYAAPPVGDLRWRAPQPPLNETGVSDGSTGYTCVQQLPKWFATANTALGDYSSYIPPGISGQTESEDCLFLDVTAPKNIYDNAIRDQTKLAPVIVNIHGGGFFIGDKFVLYYPNGLEDRANNSFVYVSMNYRLAAFGFLSNVGSSSSNRTSPNAGLLDQRAALKWVQKYIHLFGGDPDQVTITGESAGGGSVQIHGTAYGGSKETDLFIRGIAQSPTTLATDPYYAKYAANQFLRYAGVSSVEEARKLSTETLTNASIAAQADCPFDIAYFAPTIDNDLLPDLPSRLYTAGKYNKNVKMMVSNNQNEARFLGNQSITTNADFEYFVASNFPSASESVKKYIVNTLYPANYSLGGRNYSTPQERNDLAVKEYLISCNTLSIAAAYQNQTYNYIFAIPPSIHAQDLAYTYFPSGGTAGFSTTTALALQAYLISFAITGDPNPTNNEYNVPLFPIFGSNGAVINFTSSGIRLAASDAVNPRCTWWSQGLYYPSPPSEVNSY